MMVDGTPVWRDPSKLIQPLDTLLAVKALAVAPDLKATDRRVGAALIEHFNRKTGQCDLANCSFCSTIRWPSNRASAGESAVIRLPRAY
jgi:hypothetical protein